MSACGFLNERNAKAIFGSVRTLKWIAGYEAPLIGFLTRCYLKRSFFLLYFNKYNRGNENPISSVGKKFQWGENCFPKELCNIFRAEARKNFGR